MTSSLPRTDEGKFVSGIKYSPDTMFKPGQEPVNKGKKFPGSGNKASFKKGHQPHNTLYNQATRVRTNNKGRCYLYIRIAKGKWEFMQKYRWMNEIGPIPEGKILRCKNGDTLNCEPSNWILITRAENARLNRHECELKTAICTICNQEYKTRTTKSKYCSDDCRRLGNLKYMHKWYEKNPKEKKPTKRNSSTKVKTCVVCENAFFPASNNQITCSDSCRTILRHQRKQKYMIEHPKVNAEKHCSKCGQKFTPAYVHRTICDSCKTPGPRTINCIQCGTEFISNGRGVELLCSDECRRNRKNMLRVTYGYNRTRPTKIPVYTCAHCQKEFESPRKTKYCSDACRLEVKKIHNAKRKLKYVKTKPEKTPKVSKPQKTPIKQKLNKRNPKAEKEAALNMLELNRNAPKHDGEIIRTMKIKSPDLSKMEYKVYDPKLRKTTFFRTEEKYLNYLNDNKK